MVQATTVDAAAGTPVVVKRASGEDAVRLRAVAERLRAAAHPGVVEVLAAGESDTGYELRLLHGGRPVASLAPMPPEQVAAVVAAVAATLADLHAVGIVHGHLEPSHVLVGGEGRALLCGFGDGSGDATPADDVGALGALIVALLGTDDDGAPIPERRWRRPRATAAWARRTLLLFADQACAEPPSRRPTARRLAASVSEAFPGAAIEPTPDEPSDPLDALRASADDPPARPPRLLPLAAAALGVAVLVVAGVRLARPDAPTTTGTASAPVLGAVSTTDLPPPTTTATPASPPTSTCVSLPRTAGGAGCAPVAVVGTTVTVGSATFHVGDEGDEVLVGDWDCDGEPTVAVVRPSTGEVFVFDGWAVDGELVEAPVAELPVGTEVTARPATAGCSTLVAVDAAGVETPITEAGSA